MPVFDQELEDQALDDRRVEPGFLEAVDGPRVERGLAVRARDPSRAARRLRGSRREVSIVRGSARRSTRVAGMRRRSATGFPRNPRSREIGRQSGRTSRVQAEPFGQSVDDARRRRRAVRSGPTRAVGPGRLECDHPAVVRQQAADSIGPFDQADAIAAPVVGDAQVFKGLPDVCSRYASKW